MRRHGPVIAHCTDSEDSGRSRKKGKVFRIGTVRYNWPMSAHASQAFRIAHCTDSEDLPKKVPSTPTMPTNYIKGAATVFFAGVVVRFSASNGAS